ncbi:MFS transporter small subunit [Catenuloplanes atrovinosus]|uniref:Uncharacterized protein n=1 Tax=Catenuloplanes atrovinosus TaxID=137266 RepID=A0AAE3YLS5_9ACTN|nr:hypothetical protein [Catenuloplanes atrovinosus]MDR7276169.1 hypothetical protein [Catenuloplanes atrovinosus]
MSEDTTKPAGQGVRLIVSWLLVGALLAYGVIQTGITAARLFTS